MTEATRDSEFNKTNIDAANDRFVKTLGRLLTRYDVVATPGINAGYSASLDVFPWSTTLIKREDKVYARFKVAPGGKELTFEEPIEEFPSDTLVAQIMLII